MRKSSRLRDKSLSSRPPLPLCPTVLHIWGSALTHHPHIHMIVPGGGLFLGRPEVGILPVRVLSRLFRRLFLGKARRLTHAAGRLQFFGAHT